MLTSYLFLKCELCCSLLKPVGQIAIRFSDLTCVFYCINLQENILSDKAKLTSTV